MDEFNNEIQSLITYRLEEKYTPYSFGNRLLENMSGNTLMMPRNYYRVSNFDFVEQKYLEMKYEQLCTERKEPEYYDFQRLNAYRRFLDRVCSRVDKLNKQAKDRYEMKIKEKYVGVDHEDLIKELLVDEEILIKKNNKIKNNNKSRRHVKRKK